MRVYLDSNILISIEDKEICFDDFKNFELRYSYVYSYIHILELMEAKNFEELKKFRLNTILNLTNNTYIYPGIKQFSSKIEDPEMVIETLKLNSRHMGLLRQTVNNFNIDRSKLISLLGIDENRINNYSPTEVIEYIDKAFRSRMIFGLNDIIDLSGKLLNERISSLFNLLDFVGFWKDQKSERSNLARMYDSSHTYFSSCCDFFVSNDKRARNKAKVAYEFYKIDTKVLSLDEFLKI